MSFNYLTQLPLLDDSLPHTRLPKDEHPLLSNLLPVTSAQVGGKSEMLVDSRQLHAALAPSTPHRKWIARRLEQHPCVEGTDYIVGEFRTNLSETSDRGGRPEITYGLTLRLAKLIAMSEHTPAGNRVRDYFLECERRALAVQPASSEEAMLEQLSNPDFLLKLSGKLALKLKAAEAKIEADAPKVAFSDAVAVAAGDMCLTDFGKEVAEALKSRVPKTGPRKIIDLMVSEGYLFRRSGRLYAKHNYIGLGYFRLIEKPYILQLSLHVT